MPMTRNEIDDLQRLIRQRERVLKSAAKQRSAEVIADFENQMGQQYSFDDDHVWAEAAKIANAAVTVSIALQFGADLETIRQALTKDHDGGPATLLGAALYALVDSSP